MIIECTTELDAVNTCLEAIGEQPVNVIPTAGVTEATLALKVLTRISREVQGQGLHCNTDEDYELVPDISGFITIPSNVIEIDPVDRSLDLVQRGNRFYNRTTHSFTFDRSVKCNIIWFMPFEDLPEHARHYIAVRAARAFQRTHLGSVNLNAMSQEDEQRAIVNFARAENRSDDRSFLQGPSTRRILRRRI